MEERRLVTVLFADVVGSTELGESLDPEDLRALLGRFFAIARDVVAAHGGTVEKFIGDAVMAVFGLPQAHGDDATRAASAALELRDRVRADPGLGDRLSIRIGVNSGEVVATRDAVGSGDFLITGDAVNVAARLQQTAGAWEVVCSQRTARAAGTGFSFGEPIDVELRGKTERMAVVPLLARSDQPRSPLDRRRVALIGRDADLAQLQLVARRAFSERRPFMVSLIAPPGAGKTRLLEAFLESLPEVQADARVAVAQCVPYGQRLTYWPLRALLLGLLELPDETDADGVRSRAAAWLAAAGDPAADRTADLLAATIGASETDVTDRSALFVAWRTLVELAAATRPLVLVIEDLHWSSESLLDLLEFVLHPRTAAPLVMIALTRPELLDRRPNWGGGRRNYVSLSLEPLDDRAVAELVEQLLEGPAPALVPVVVERSEGNPFYAGEIVRAIAERAPALDDPAQIQAAIATLPDTVQATVLARLDLLEPAPRRVLQLGSIFGRAFRLPAVRALEPSLDGSADDAVDQLLERDLVRSAGPEQFTFRHILIREVAYRTLPRAERARLHSAAARWLEVQAATREDLVELVAFHYREAATLTGAGSARDPELSASAAAWLRRAGDVALAAAANIEAARHYEAAIELAAPEEQPELYGALGAAYSAGDRSVDAYRRASELGEEHGRPADFVLRNLADMLMVMMRWYASVARQPEERGVVELRRKGRTLLDHATDERVRAAFLIADGFFPFWVRSSGAREPTAAEVEDMRTSVETGLAIAERIDDARLVSAALDAMTSIPRRAREIYETSRRRLALADRLPLEERLDTHYMLGWWALLMGDLEEAIGVSERGLALAQPGQGPGFGVGLAAWKTFALMLQGRWDDVAPAVDQAVQIWIEWDRASASFAVGGFLAALDVARGRGDDRLVERCREILDATLAAFDAPHPTAALSAVATLDLDAVAADVVGGHERYRQRPHVVERAIAVCADRSHPMPVAALREFAASVAGDMPIVEAQARRGVGLAERDPGDLRHALELFERHRAVPYVARTRVELGRLTGDHALAEQGIAGLEALGDLDQVSRYEAG
ncbi:MAG: AAA family ATPase [Chloroflexota bacterium]|nr:AAA family ATPase [Chloroflexota bacterium]